MIVKCLRVVLELVLVLERRMNSVVRRCSARSERARSWGVIADGGGGDGVLLSAGAGGEEADPARRRAAPPALPPPTELGGRCRRC